MRGPLTHGWYDCELLQVWDVICRLLVNLMAHWSYDSASSLLEICLTESHKSLPRASLGILIGISFITVKTLTATQMVPGKRTHQ